MSHVFHRSTASVPPIAVSGMGVTITGQDGSEYLDASGGAAVSCLGHSHPAVIKAVQDQIATLPFAHTGFFSNTPMEELADHLIAKSAAIPGSDLDKVYFVSGGSEAMEAALKLARQYYVERGQPERRHLIARRQSYHGNTLGALAAGGNEWRRDQFRPLLIDTTHIAPCYAYRDRQEGETFWDYGQRVAEELEQKIQELGPETVIAFVAEPVVGATAGAVPAVPGYFKRVKQICEQYDILLILDEVMCGMGRTGSLFACEQDGVAPDILITAKGLGAGYQPIGAALVSSQIYDAIRDGSGFFQHGHTYMGHATACAAALAVQIVIEQEDLLTNVRRQGTALREALESRLGNHQHVGDIRGRGLFLGLELVQDRLTKKPFAPSAKLHAKVKRAALDRGLMCYPMGGTIDGKMGDHILLAPPFIIGDSEVRVIVDRLGEAVDDAINSLESKAA
ncbi:MAG: aspartate aminotransferase family protein [Pseudomonadota bacterium]